MRLVKVLAALTALAPAAIICAGSAQADRFLVEHVFKGGSDGATPFSKLTQVGGKLYGTTIGGGVTGFGTIFAFDPATGVETVAYTFKGGADGAMPRGSLIKAGHRLYGATAAGGSANVGTVFSFDPTTAAEKVVYAFKNSPDGADADTGVVEAGGLLFGTTFGGGTQNLGTVFSIDPSTHRETVAHSFTGDTDGLKPASGLIEINGTLYGTTEGGGDPNANCSLGCGTVFSVNPTTGEEKVVYAFTGSSNEGGSDGIQPNADMITLGGVLFGTTELGGLSGEGIVFSLNPDTGAEAVVYSFKGADGVYPGGLFVVRDKLIGVTVEGGTKGFGETFSLDPTTGFEKLLHSFAGGARGSGPIYPVVKIDGRLYGVAGGGSAKCLSCGTLYSLKP